MGLPLELDVSLPLESEVWASWQKPTKGESAPWILVPIVDRDRCQIHTNRTAIIGSRYSTLLQVELLTKEQPVTVRISLPIKEWIDNMFPYLTLPWLRSYIDEMACLPIAEEYCVK